MTPNPLRPLAELLTPEELLSVRICALAHIEDLERRMARLSMGSLLLVPMEAAIMEQRFMADLLRSNAEATEATSDEDDTGARASQPKSAKESHPAQNTTPAKGDQGGRAQEDNKVDQASGQEEATSRGDNNP